MLFWVQQLSEERAISTQGSTWFKSQTARRICFSGKINFTPAVECNLTWTCVIVPQHLRIGHGHDGISIAVGHAEGCHARKPRTPYRRSCRFERGPPQDGSSLHRGCRQSRRKELEMIS